MGRSVTGGKRWGHKREPACLLLVMAYAGNGGDRRSRDTHLTILHSWVGGCAKLRHECCLSTIRIFTRSADPERVSHVIGASQNQVLAPVGFALTSCRHLSLSATCTRASRLRDISALQLTTKANAALRYPTCWHSLQPVYRSVFLYHPETEVTGLFHLFVFGGSGA